MRSELLFDFTRLVERVRRPTATGIDRVMLEYATFLLRQPGVRFCMWSEGALRSLPRWLVRAIAQYLGYRWSGSAAGSEGFRLDPLVARAARIASRKRIIGWLTAAAARSIELDVSAPVIYLNVSHRYLTKLAGHPLNLRSAVRVVVMLHDILPVTNREWYTPELSDEFEAGLRSVSERADLVLSVSDATANQYRVWTREHGFRDPVVVTVEPGSHVEATSVTSAARQFLFVGSLNERKNLALLARLWRELETELQDPPELLVAGSAESETSFRELFAGLACVRHVQGASDCDVERLMRSSRALLAPSLAEGFGLTIREALARGVPVLCSDLEAHREAGLGVPEYLNPTDVSAWRAAVLEYVAPGSPRRGRQLEKLAQVQIPTWSQHFERVLRAIDAIG